MKRWRFNFAAAVSAIMCILLIADWFIQKNYFYWFDVSIWGMQGHNRVAYSLGITTRHGGVILSYGAMLVNPKNRRVPLDNFDYGIVAEKSRPANLGSTFLNRVGFRYSVDSWVELDDSDYYGRISATNTSLCMPTWFLVTVFAVLPMVALRRWRRQREALLREARGLCLTCGYDLRATLERCPECGTSPALATTSA